MAADPLSALREELCRVHHELARAGLVILSFGNASAVDRESGVVLIKPSGVACEAIEPDMLVAVSLEGGRPLEDRYRPSSDTPTHLVLYRRYREIGGIVHTHSPRASAWAQARRPIPPFGTTHADHFHGPIPVTRPLSESETEGEYELETGRVIVETLDGASLHPFEMPAVLVASHGPFVWGATATEAAENAIALETVAAMATETLLLEPLARPVERVLLDRHYRRKHGPSAYYGQRSPRSAQRPRSVVGGS
jgi:L-ribulose-5-phosphate 4-epimerase